jgi:hypothetical protein
MKVMKNMRGMIGSIKRKREFTTPAEEPRATLIFVAIARDGDADAASANNSEVDTPEANAARNVVC